MTWATLAEWSLVVAKSVAMFVAFAIVWSLRNAFIAGWNIHRFISQFETYRLSNDKALGDLRTSNEKMFADLFLRLDEAGQKMSDFSDELQNLPERMRRDFMPRPEIELQFAENKADRQLLRDEITNLWKRVNEREERRRR